MVIEIFWVEFDELEVNENPVGGDVDKEYSKEELVFEQGASTS